MEEKLCSIEEFEKNKNKFEKKPYVNKYLYRIKVENIPGRTKKFVVEVAYRQKNPKDLEWKVDSSFDKIEYAQQRIDKLIEERKICDGYYIEAYINYPENQ